MASASSHTRSSSARPMIERPHAVLHDLLDRDHLATALGRPGEDDVEALVERHLGAAVQLLGLDVGMKVDPHLAAAGEHIDGAVVVLADHDAVGRRRAGQLVDLVAERGDVLTSLPQRVAQLLVLRHGLGQLTLGLEQALLQGPDPLGPVGHLAPQAGDLLVEQARLLVEPGQLGRVGAPRRRCHRALCRSRCPTSGRHRCLTRSHLLSRRTLLPECRRRRGNSRRAPTPAGAVVVYPVCAV